MLLDAIVIVVRESLEAGVLISLLLSMLNRYLSPYWLIRGLLIGVVGTALYLINMPRISQWFDYVGQEVVNATLQYGLAVLLCLLLVISAARVELLRPKMVFLAMAIVAIALVREGSELMLYFINLVYQNVEYSQLATSAFVGLAIGASVGAFVYYLLAGLGGRQAQICYHILLSMIAAGMVSQGTQLLLQADWLPSGLPLWDSSWILSESSIPGMVAYAVFGYEANPSLIEVIFYVSTLAVLLVSQLISCKIVASSSQVSRQTI